TLQADGLHRDPFTLDASGGSTATIAGSIPELTVTVSGDSTLDASKLMAATVHVDVSGESKAAVCASNRLDGSATGGSDVSYSSAPTLVNVDASGASHVPGS